MKKHMRLKIDSRIDDYPTERVVSLTILHESVGEWALGLCLLDHGLVDLLAITSLTAALQLELAILPRSSARTRASLDWTEEPLKLRISEVELQHWIRFFLKYVRDGYGEVDHIDVEIQPNNTSTGRATTVVLKVQRSAAPVSAQEALRRLGA